MAIRSRPILTTVVLIVLGMSVLEAQTVHVLARGETLYSLSRRYDVELDDLLARNGIEDPSDLAVGTRLYIPGEAAPVSGQSFHTVAAGETYYSIARAYGMSVDELLQMNGRAASRILRVGESLIVAEAPEATALPPGDAVETRPAAAERVDAVPWWPVAGRKRPLDGKLVGVAISAEPMSYVHAVASGDVVWTGPYRGFGHVVLVDSGGYIYLYGGNEDLFVNVGQSVSAGNRIGRLGPSGPAGNDQDMIFSVFRDGVPVSPDSAPRG